MINFWCWSGADVDLRSFSHFHQHNADPTLYDVFWFNRGRNHACLQNMTMQEPWWHLISLSSWCWSALILSCLFNVVVLRYTAIIKSRRFFVSGFTRSVVSSCICRMVQRIASSQKCNYFCWKFFHLWRLVKIYELLLNHWQMFNHVAPYLMHISVHAASTSQEQWVDSVLLGTFPS